jgi:hypothetical protein
MPGIVLDSKKCDRRLMAVMFSKALRGATVEFRTNCSTARIGDHVIDLETDIERQLRDLRTRIRDRA